MSEDINQREIVDKFDNLQRQKADIENQIQEARELIIKFANENNLEFLPGTSKNCSIKSYTKVVYPEDKNILISAMKTKGLYEQFSSINYFKLSPKILKGDIDKEIIKLVKKEKAYRVSLVDKNKLVVS